ncbi:hypothetical protein DO692_08685 [Salmonella enterica subsp. enterica serovar Carmel]|nr:hypothetical protein [Salmonella enterica subsp. enterica serovar Carmel]
MDVQELNRMIAEAYRQIHWAASLLIQVAGTWPREDMPELLTPERGSALFNDAEQLLANGLGAANQL